MANPKSKRIKITFDKKELLAKTNKFSIREARRQSGNFYDALVQELLEDGCPTSAKYFKLLSCKEMDYYKKSIIRDRVKNEPTLLLAIYDHCKMAERTALLKQSEGMPVTFRLLYQVMCLLEQDQYAKKFNWLQRDVYKIIANISDKLGGGKEYAGKTISEIYFKYANLLSKDGSSELALQYYEKTLHIVQTNNWSIDFDRKTGKNIYVHSLVAQKFSDELLKFARQICSDDYSQAVALARKSLCIISQVGTDESKQNLAFGRLNIAEFYIEGECFVTALSILKEIEKELIKFNLKGGDVMEMRLSFNKGVCYENLGQPDNAMEYLRKSLLISQRLKQKSIEGKILTHIGKLYLHKGGNQRNLAKQSFTKSMEIFKSLNDIQNLKKSQYFLAQTMSQSLDLIYLDLIKEREKSGNYYNLRRWKYMLEPFWTGLHLKQDKFENDQVKYLMEEFKMKSNQERLFEI